MCQKFVEVFNKQQDVLFISSYILNQLSSNLDDKQRDQLRLTHIGSRVSSNSHQYGKLTDTVKPVLSGHSKRTPTIGFNADYCLMQVKSVAQCSNGSILQYFRPSLSYHYPLRSLFCLLLSGHLRRVLL